MQITGFDVGDVAKTFVRCLQQFCWAATWPVVDIVRGHCSCMGRGPRSPTEKAIGLLFWLAVNVKAGSRRCLATSNAASTVMTHAGRASISRHLLTADASEFEREVNELRTHQGQSDVFVINPKGSILAPTFVSGRTRW